MPGVFDEANAKVRDDEVNGRIKELGMEIVANRFWNNVTGVVAVALCKMDYHGGLNAYIAGGKFDREADALVNAVEHGLLLSKDETEALFGKRRLAAIRESLWGKKGGVA